LTSSAASALIGSAKPSDHGRSETSEPSDIPVDILVETEISADIAETLARQKEIDDQAFDLTGERDTLEKRDPDDPQVGKLTRQIVLLIERGTALSERLQALRSPGEHERRVNERLVKQASLRRLTDRRNTVAKETAKDQGFPDAYLNEKGGFKIGMDARAKSDLVLSALGQITKENPGNSLHVFSEKEATALLQKRDWMGFLERKRALIQADEQKKAEAAKKREEQARERAAEKEKRDAEKAAAKAEKANAADAAAAKAQGQATPDPKGGGKRSSAKAATK
jgi:hypothetical protein